MSENLSDELCDLRDLNEHVIGIDLGTTNTCVGIWRNESLEIIPDEYGNRTIPSYVAYTNINRYIGLEAKKQKDLNPKNVFYEVKRYIGRKIDDPLVTKERNLFSYDLSHDEHNNIVLVPEINSKLVLTPEEISAAILTKARIMASEYLGEKVTKCVITIPAYFNDGQRQATKDAATIAGLECIRIINEPTAAALANGLLKRSKVKDNECKNILVYDFGGGTLDVSILEIEDGRFLVKASSGNTRMGGSDFDNRLMSYCMGRFQKKYGIKELTEVNSLGLQKLRLQCEQAKKVLSLRLNTQIAVRDFYDGKDLYVTISRAEFEKICKELFLVCLKPIDDALEACDMDIEDIDEIILVGGMTLMPKIRELIKCRFGRDPNCSMNPDESVAAGAAIQAYILSHYTDPFSTSVTLMDTVALAIGVETVGGVMDPIIERGDVIPTKGTKSYSTVEDYVDTITVQVYEGERKMVKDNFLIGTFDLGGIEKEPRGVPEIDVKVTIDENGLINVTARNMKTADEVSLPVTSNKGRLTKAQIENLVAEAQELEVRDQLNKRKKMMHYQLSDFCNNIIVNLSNGNFKLSDRDKITIKDDVQKAIQWLSDCKYFERSDKEYKEMTEAIKKRYGVLLLTGHIDDGKLHDFSDNKGTEMTTIYGDENEEDEEMKRVFEQVEKEENGFDEMSEMEVTELKELRQKVFDVCYSMCEILYSGNLTISKEHIGELKDYINESLMWLHICEKPTKIDYKMKIDEIDDACNKVFDYYKNEGQDVFKQNEILTANKTCRDELENMCIVFQLMIADGAFPIDEPYLSKFKSKIDDVLTWMAEQEQNINLEEESELKMNYYAECNDQLANLNNYCADLNQKLHGVNINEKVDILGKNRIILTGMAANFESDISEDTGVDLITIRQQEQKQILEDMINKDFTDDDTEINEEAFEIKYDDNTKNSINITNKNKMKKAKKHKNVSKCEKRRKRAISKKRRMRRH
jgi:molecular chaperone DnaK (HSP70)